MIKALVGYDIVEGVSREEYERWLHEVHVPDLMANPHIDRIVFNTVIRPVLETSGGTGRVEGGLVLYRIAEMHYRDMEAYERYLAWFREHPIPPERGPVGRTDFKFYLLTESEEIGRDGPSR